MTTRSSPMLQSYSEFLASSFGNFTQTYFADHSETQNGSSPTIFLKLLPPQSASRQRYAGRSSSFIANGNKPPECNGVNPKNKELNSITSQPRCWLGPIFIRQQCWPKQPSTPSNRDCWMTTSANSSGIQLSQLLLRKS